jgi:hypothetical protein
MRAFSHDVIEKLAFGVDCVSVTCYALNGRKRLLVLND